MTSRLEQRTSKTVTPGTHWPLGATLVDGGVSFAVCSEHADAISVELFDDPVGPPTDVIPLAHRTRHVRHARVHGIGAGQLYALRAAGPFDPAHGLRFNEHKLLIDPYARALTGRFRNDDCLLLAYDPRSEGRDLTIDTRDSSPVVPRCIVVDDAFDWQGDSAPQIPLDDLVIYEVHIRGFTRHPSSGVRHPGTFLGFADKIPYLKRLGINAVELLPVHAFHVEELLLSRGLTNYWGYNTVAFFAPEPTYGTGRAPGCEVAEFKTLVRELHRAGIEVILDVVYNHTAEGNELGPTMSLRGLDNPTSYVLCGPPHEPGRHYMNHTGCGNSLNLTHPAVIRLVMDSLRYWTEVVHVDGFRFDLASVLGREPGGFQKAASFFDVVSQDPTLARVKLIAEPWDLGTYQVGNFPVDWSEWNGRYRDTVRRFGKGDPDQVRELGWRLTGSADLYGDDGRSAFNSVNFVTCHDGFTLHDLVSYDAKHNEANLEDNRDGANDNHSWNSGAEGSTDDEGVLALRRRRAKSLIAILFSSLGTPMLLGGDEVLRTQRGNNNAYCQDNEISWFDWTDVERNADMVELVRRAIAFNRRHSILHRRKFPTGRDESGDRIPDISWFGPDLDRPAWENPIRTLCFMLDGAEAPSPLGRYLLFFVLNGDSYLQRVRIPPAPEGLRWHRIADTSLPAGEDFMLPGEEVLLAPDDHYLANPMSVVILIAR
jgi:glycogen operon protein